VVLLTRPFLLAAAAAAVALAGWAALALVPHGRSGAPPPPRERGAITVLDVADGLGAVTAGHGDLWMDDRVASRLLRVDGASGRVLAAIPVDGRVAVGASRTGVWALQSGGGAGIELLGPLLRIDPASDRVTARVPLGGMLGFGVLAQGRSVWIWGPSDVLRVDPRTNRVAQRIAVGGAHGEIRGLALRGRHLVALAADGRLLRYDAVSGARTGAVSVPFPAPTIRATVGRRLVLASRGAVAVVDPRSGRVAWRRRLGFRVGAVRRAHGLLWAHSASRDEPGDRVTALEPSTGRVRGSMLLPAFGTTGMALQRGRLWLPSAGGRVVVVRLPGER
jgi:outer membrane protein assembly factor BamB